MLVLGVHAVWGSCFLQYTPFLGDHLEQRAIKTREHSSEIHAKCPGSRTKGRGVRAYVTLGYVFVRVMIQKRKNFVFQEKKPSLFPFYPIHCLLWHIFLHVIYILFTCYLHIIFTTYFSRCE